MKHNKSFLILLSIILLLAISCNKNNLNPNQKIQSSSIDYISIFPDTLLLQGKTPAQKLDSVATWHNSYQKTLLQKMIDAQLNLIDTGSLNNFIVPRTDSFFLPKYITPAYYGFKNYVGPEDTLIAINLSDYSVTGGSLLQKLSYLLNEYARHAPQAFYDSLALLRTAALTLPSDTEKMSVGIHIAIADSSSRFWMRWGQLYATELSWYMSWPDNNTIQPNYIKPPFHLNKGALIKADIKGAVSGAVEGIPAGGVLGSVAGGVLLSATSSFMI